MSSSNSSVSSSGGIGFAGMLTILFIGLKITGNLDWSWWWVLSPLWIGLALFLAVLAVIFLMAGLFAGIGALLVKKRVKTIRRR